MRPTIQPSVPAAPAPTIAPGPTPAQRVELHVESLVLTGFQAGHRHRIGAALQVELTRLLEERGLPDGLVGGLDAALLRAAEAEFPADAAPATIGRRVARSVYDALTGRER